MDTHWFTLYSDTFLWVKGDNGLIYSASNNQSRSFKIFNRVKRLCDELLILKNLYSISISEEDMNDSDVQQLVQFILEIKGGFLTPNTSTKKKPLSLKPVIKIHDEIDYYRWKDSKGFGGDIMQNLHELTFYINSSKNGNDFYYRQTIFPLQNCGYLDLGKILTFVRHSRNPYLTNINLVGNIFSYIEYHRLIEGLIELSIPIYLHITLKDFQQYFKQINDFQWPEYVRFNILIDNLYDELIIPLQNIQAQIKLSVLVFSEKDYLLLSEKIKNKSISDTRIIPIYNSQNLDFFKSNVFTDLDELSNIVLTKQEIFMRQSLNILNFGKLTIMPDGTVYANVNYEPLGLIDDTVYSLVYKEFAEGQSWLQIRNQVPCANCIYQWLCPSPSNYETAIGQQNLCSIKL